MMLRVVMVACDGIINFARACGHPGARSSVNCKTRSKRQPRGGGLPVGMRSLALGHPRRPSTRSIDGNSQAGTDIFVAPGLFAMAAEGVTGPRLQEGQYPAIRESVQGLLFKSGQGRSNLLITGKLTRPRSIPLTRRGHPDRPRMPRLVRNRRHVQAVDRPRTGETDLGTGGTVFDPGTKPGVDPVPGFRKLIRRQVFRRRLGEKSQLSLGLVRPHHPGRRKSSEYLVDLAEARPGHPGAYSRFHGIELNPRFFRLENHREEIHRKIAMAQASCPECRLATREEKVLASRQ